MKYAIPFVITVFLMLSYPFTRLLDNRLGSGPRGGGSSFTAFNFECVSLDIGGNALVVKGVRVDDDGEQYVITKPEGLFRDRREGRAPVHYRAETGYLGKDNAVRLERGVVMTMADARLGTDRLMYDPERGEVSGDAPVHVTRPDGEFDAQSFVYDVGAGVLRAVKAKGRIFL